MAISDKIKAKANAVHQERVQNPKGPYPIADEVQTKATNAILGGTQEWVTYMSIFTTDPAELARLIPTDGTTDPARQQARAYLVANGMCGMGTSENLPINVTLTLD